MKSHFVLFSTIVALGLAALAVFIWGTRPEPTLMLLIGAELAIVGSAARRRTRQSGAAMGRTLGVSR